MNDSSSPSTQCSRCGAVLPPNAPEGLCPRCLAALPLGTETAFTGETKGPAHSPRPPEELAPHFPQLEILECLGRGGMGVVYKARQKSLNRLVALKLLAPERADDPQFAARFEKEAQALAALNHPNIVAVHDFGQAGGFYYLLMEFVDGVNLRQLLQSRRLTPKEALGIVPPVCDALQFAHEHGIVHRDIKPENLLLDKAGRVKIADFGIAKIIAASPGEAGGGEKSPSPGTATLNAGTPAYAAPEQREAHGEADHRADIYSLGVVLYEMLTGERPQARFELPSRRVQVDVRIDDIVLRALQDTPERRYQTAAEFRTQVESIGRPTDGPGEPTTEGAALRAIHAWLELFDRGEYASTWDTASTWFHNTVTKESWITNVQGVRPPLGALISREVIDTRFVAGGSQFQARFKTAFAGLPEAVETVNTMREPDGTWKGTGYLIRPAGYEDLRHRRLAAIGAWWALLVPVAAVLLFLLRSQAMGRPIPAFLELLFAPFLIAGISAPIGTTVLGWMATAHLRRSTKRQGLWLAVFDGLLFPLLALDLAIGAVWFTIVGILSSLLNFPTSDPRALDHILVAVWVLLSVVTAAFTDWHITRRVWRTVNRQPGNAPGRESSSGTPLWWFGGATIVAVLLIWALFARETPRIPPPTTTAPTTALPSVDSYEEARIRQEEARTRPPAAETRVIDHAAGARALIQPPGTAEAAVPGIDAPAAPTGRGASPSNAEPARIPSTGGAPSAQNSDPIHEADMRVLRTQYEKTLNELYEAKKDLALFETQADGSAEERLKKADLLTQKVRMLENRCAELRAQIQVQTK